MGRLKILEVNRVFQSPLRGSATFLVITGGLRHRLISNGPPGLNRRLLQRSLKGRDNAVPVKSSRPFRDLCKMIERGWD